MIYPHSHSIDQNFDFIYYYLISLFILFINLYYLLIVIFLNIYKND